MSVLGDIVSGFLKMACEYPALLCSESLPIWAGLEIVAPIQSLAVPMLSSVTTLSLQSLHLS